MIAVLCRLDKVSYLCTMILNYLNYGIRQEVIILQSKFADVLIGDNDAKEMCESANQNDIYSKA